MSVQEKVWCHTCSVCKLGIFLGESWLEDDDEGKGRERLLVAAVFFMAMHAIQVVRCEIYCGLFVSWFGKSKK